MKPSASRNRWIAGIAAGIALVAVAVMVWGSAIAARLGWVPESAGRSRASGAMRIVVTIPPLSELAQRLAPAGSEVMVLMQPGRSEHGYEFTPADIASLAKADIVVYVGLGLEPHVEEFLRNNSSPTRRDVCFAVAAGVSPLAAEDREGSASHEGHDHGEGHDDHGHDHHGIDPHLWLDPSLVERLVPVLAGAVGASMKASGADSPQAVAALVESEERLLRDVGAIDAEYRRELDPRRGGVIVTHHNAWGRLADRYGLKIAAIIRPVESAEPTPGQIATAVEAIRTQGAKTIFVEPQFDAQGARQIASAAGARVAVLDPLGTGSWFAMMRSNLKALVEGM